MDNYKIVKDDATLQQLIVLSNMESLNAEMINKDIDGNLRLQKLNRLVREHLKSLVNNEGVKIL